MVTLSENSCRVCLNCPGFGEEYRPLATLQHNERDGKELYQNILGVVSLVDGPNYPQQLCFQCENILIAFYNFRQQCQKNEKLLNDYLNCDASYDGKCCVEVLEDDSDSGLDTHVGTPSVISSYSNVLTTEEIDSVVESLIKSSETSLPTLGAIDLIDVIDTDTVEAAAIAAAESANTTSQSNSKDSVRPKTRGSKLKNSQAKKAAPVTFLGFDENTIISNVSELMACCGKKFLCTICDNNYKTKYDLKRHCYRHYNVEIEKPGCSHCSLTFDKHSHLKRHVEKLHLREDHFQCATCLRKFYNAFHLKMHLHNSHKPRKKWELKRKPCPQCGEMVQRLQRHISRFHEGIVYICDLCNGNRTYKNKVDLKAHMQTVHLNQKLHKCNFCNLRFAGWVSKSAHEIKAHTKKYPFVCTICEYKCCSKIRYEDHLRSHIGEKVYKCPICMFGYATTSSLKQHYNSHSMVSENKCDQCKVYFRRTKHLARHIENHHDKPHIPLFQCPICPGKPIFGIDTLGNHFNTCHPDVEIAPTKDNV